MDFFFLTVRWLSQVAIESIPLVSHTQHLLYIFIYDELQTVSAITRPIHEYFAVFRISITSIGREWNEKSDGRVQIQIK